MAVVDGNSHLPLAGTLLPRHNPFQLSVFSTNLSSKRKSDESAVQRLQRYKEMVDRLQRPKKMVDGFLEKVRCDEGHVETSELILECIDNLDHALALRLRSGKDDQLAQQLRLAKDDALARLPTTFTVLRPDFYSSSLHEDSDQQAFLCPLCDSFNTQYSGSRTRNFYNYCRICFTKVQSSSHTIKIATAMETVNATATDKVAWNIPGISHSLKAKSAIIGNSSSNSSCAPYQESKSESRLTVTLDQDGTEQVFHIGDESSDGSHLQSGVDATEMSTQHLVEREDMEMLTNRQASSLTTACSSTNSAGQVTLFSRVKAVARWPSVLCNRVRSYFTHRSDQEGATSLQPNGSSLDLEAGNGTEMSPISNGSSEDPEEGNVTDEIPQNPQSNHSPKHFGMFIFFFAVNLVLAHVRDTYNDSSSSTKANWHSYYFGGTITVSFISTLCANILAKYEKAARILEKIGIGFGASGFIMAMVELLLPNMTWIAWIATPIVWIAVILS